MSPTSQQVVAAAPLQRLETPPPSPAKAKFQNLENADWARDGEALQLMCFLAKVSQKQAAYTVRMDESQFSKQCRGTERPQVERFISHDDLRGPMLMALAHKTDTFDVVMTITVRQR